MSKTQFFVIRPKNTIFFIVYFFVFLLSGLLSMVYPPYRMGLVSLIILPLFLIHGIKGDKVSIAYGCLTFCILLSALVNGSSIIQFALFLRTLLFSYLIYYLVKVYINQNNIIKIFKLCVWIGILQLPVVIVQIFLYDYLPSSLIKTFNLFEGDFYFGTFNLKSDASMAFFLTTLIIFLLFDDKRNYIIKHKWLIILWFSLTVFITNSQMIKIILILIWGFYVFVNYKKKSVILFLATLILLGSAFAFLNSIHREKVSPVEILKSEVSAITSGNTDRYLSGSYSRGGALAYYFSSEFSWLGDGPSAYFDPISRTLTRGNTGHFFTFYSEVGVLGWLLSVMIIFLIAMPIKHWRIKVHVVTVMLFVAIQLLSFTSTVMNDISIFLAYNILVNHHLIPSKDQSVQ